MSTAIAMAPSPAPHDRSNYVDMAPTGPTGSSPPTGRRNSATSTPNNVQRNESGSPNGNSTSKGSPSGSRNGVPPKIIVKKEPPSSPDLPTSRHRPRRLDLSKNNSTANPATARPATGQLTGRESGGLGIQDVGIACLSPGFVTQDPSMREHLQRSISVREQQRQIIEARLQQTAKPGDAAPTTGAALETPKNDQQQQRPGGIGGGMMMSGAKTLGTTGGRRKAPPGLSIVAPSHEQFANERVIQSAPLNQSFTGRHQPHPLTRHVQNQPSNLSNTSHIHHVPANQTSNRLPPIADVFAAAEHPGMHRESGGGGGGGAAGGAPASASASRSSFFPQNSGGSGNSGNNHSGSASNSSHSNSRPNFPSPTHHGMGHGGGPSSSSMHQQQHQHQHQQQQHQGQHQQHQHQHQQATHHSSSRPREYRSAEEAQVELSGGRPELLPKIVHYGGHQPPTPPSPHGVGGNGPLTGNSILRNGNSSSNNNNNNNNGNNNGNSMSNSNAGNGGGGGGGARRRPRAEYEEGVSPPLGTGPAALGTAARERRFLGNNSGPFGEGRDGEEETRRKKEEFMRLCDRAWDLFHS